MPNSSVNTEQSLLSLRKENEDLKKELNFFISTYEDTLAGYWDWHIQDNYEYLSPRFKAMFGYSDNEMPNHPDSWQKIIHPGDLPKVLEAFEAHVKDGIPYENEVRYYHKDGSIIWVYCRGKVVEWDDDGKPVRMLGSHVDITDLKNKESALRESNLRFKLAIEGAHDGIWDWQDVNQDKEWWSPQFYRLLGYENNEIEATLTSFRKLLHPSDHKRTFDAVEKHFSEDIPFNIEYRLQTKAGYYKWFHARATVLRDKEGVPVRMAGCITDIHEQKELTRKMQHTQKLESLGLLAGGIAHDFNNLLTIILGNAGLAKMTTPETSSNYDCLDKIEKSSLVAADLCFQMLAYSGKGRIIVHPINLNELIEDTVQMFDISVPKNITIKYDLSNPLPAINADIHQIRQILMNLVTNAAEAIDGQAGMITLATSIKEYTSSYLRTIFGSDNPQAGFYVVMEVSDTGIGMEKETREKIFDPFFSTKFSGRGLGLAAVLGIMNSHKGFIRVDSEIGVGTTFRLLFPASVDMAQALTKETEYDSEWNGSGSALVVDDEEYIRGLGSKILKHVGFDVITATDGSNGVNLYRQNQHKIEIVILDMTMPVMNGEDTLIELQKINPEVKVLLSSGYTEYEATNRFSGKGLAGFIQKPYRPQDLIRKVKDVLEGSLS